MLCDICHVREATIRFTQVYNLKKKELNICKVCAEEKGFSNPLVGLQKLFGSLLFLTQLEKEEPEYDQKDVELRCKSCNLTWKAFQKEGLLGCKGCYSAFDEKLKVLLRRIHGSNKHIGNRPSNRRILEKKPDLQALKNKLKIAINKEDYEQAAKLRDRIRDIEASLNRMEKI